MVILLALTAAVLYGVGDFLGGAASRGTHVLSVLVLATPSGAAVVIAAALASGPPAGLAGLAWGAVAGAIGGIGLMIFMSALAAGPMSVVAPVAALTATLLPVGVAVAGGERPGTAVCVGAVLCLLAIVLTSAAGEAPADRPADQDAGRNVRQAADPAAVLVAAGVSAGGPGPATPATPAAPAWPAAGAPAAGGYAAASPHQAGPHASGPYAAGLAGRFGAAGSGPAGSSVVSARVRMGSARAAGYGVASGALFGLFFLFMRNSGQSGAFWPVATARVAELAVILIAAAIVRPGPVRRSAGRWLLLAAVGYGVIDAVANICYVAATMAGLFGVAVVLTSLYPGVTVLLARVVLGERLRRVQRVGLALAAVGILLVTV